MKTIIWCGLFTSKCSGKPHHSTTLLMTGHLIWRRLHCAWACHSIVNLNRSHIYRCMMQPCMQINSGKILQHQQPRYSATRAISFKGGRESVRTLRRHHHQMKASVPARPSKSISSNFQKMNSFGDAICLSIARGHGAQVRSSSCSMSHDMSQASLFTWALFSLHCCTSSEVKSTFTLIFSTQDYWVNCTGNVVGIFGTICILVANSMDQNPPIIGYKWLKFGVLRAAERATVIMRVVHDINATVTWKEFRF